MSSFCHLYHHPVIFIVHSVFITSFIFTLTFILENERKTGMKSGVERLLTVSGGVHNATIKLMRPIVVLVYYMITPHILVHTSLNTRFFTLILVLYLDTNRDRFYICCIEIYNIFQIVQYFDVELHLADCVVACSLICAAMEKKTSRKLWRREKPVRRHHYEFGMLKIKLQVNCRAPKSSESVYAYV